MFLGENFFISNESWTPFFWHSACSKIHWEESFNSIHYNVHAVSLLVMVLLTSGIHVAIFIKKRKLQKQNKEGIMVVNYNMDGVTISRRCPDVQSCAKLWKHNRTVISPKASLMSFLLALITLSCLCFLYFNVGPSGPPIWGDFLLALMFCELFFLFNLVETILSPTLCNSLLDIFPRRYPAYHVTEA